MARLSNPEIVRLIVREAQLINSLVYIENIDCFAKFVDGKNYFKILSQNDFEKYIYKYMIATDIINQVNITTNLVKDIAKQMCWQLPNHAQDVITPYVAIRDGVINLETFEIEEVDRSKNVFFFVNTTKEKIEKGCDKKGIWIKFLESVIVDEKGKTHQPTIKVMQEMFGYYLMNTLQGHTSFFLNGKGANGKSVVLSVLREMVGRDFTTTMTVQDLTTDQFATSTLIGKKINICAEDESKFTRSDKFKAMISGDDVTVRRMYKPGFSWIPTVKYIFSTNDMPTFTGVGEALLRRIKIVPFNYWIPKEKRIPYLEKKLVQDMGAIVAWSLEGAKRLTANNYQFSTSELMEGKLEEFKQNLSASILFVSEQYKLSEDETIEEEDLYENYKVWCLKRGKKAQSYYRFKADIEGNVSVKTLTNEITKIKSYLLKPIYGNLAEQETAPF